jgi:hypothetical protein
MTASWTVTDHLSSTSTTTQASFTLAPQATIPVGSLIIVTVNEVTSTTQGTLADSGGNTYTQIGPQHPNAVAANGSCSIWYVISSTHQLTTGSTWTYTKVGTTHNCAMAAISVAYSGTTTLNLNTTPTTGNSAAPSITSGAPAKNNELFVAVLGSGNISTGSFTQDSLNAAWQTGPDKAFPASSGGAVAGGNVANATNAALTWAPAITSAAWCAFLISFAQTNQATSLTAAQGSFSLTGEAASQQITLAASTGMFSLVGGLISGLHTVYTQLRNLAASLYTTRVKPPTLST